MNSECDEVFYHTAHHMAMLTRHENAIVMYSEEQTTSVPQSTPENSVFLYPICYNALRYSLCQKDTHPYTSMTCGTTRS